MELYFAPLACSMATRIALYEAGASARFRQVDTRERRVLEDGSDYLAINPLGQVPALRTDAGDLFTENTAILQHVARNLPGASLLGSPDGLPRLQQWLSFIGTELHKSVYTPLLGSRVPAAAKDYARTLIPARFGVLERHLEGQTFLLETFTIADAYLATVLNWSGASGIDLGEWPATRAWHTGILKRPSIARALDEERALYAEEQARRAA